MKALIFLNKNTSILSYMSKLNTGQIINNVCAV